MQVQGLVASLTVHTHVRVESTVLVLRQIFDTAVDARSGGQQHWTVVCAQAPLNSAGLLSPRLLTGTMPCNLVCDKYSQLDASIMFVCVHGSTGRPWSAAMSSEKYASPEHQKGCVQVSGSQERALDGQP